jgi:putative DNA primase/helicase
VTAARTAPEQTAERIVRFLDLIAEPGQVIELRALKVKDRYGKPYTVAGYFDAEHRADLAAEALRLTEMARGVYFTLNPINPELVARCYNRTDRSEEDSLTKENNILRRRVVPIDVDPVRDSKVSATEAQKRAARETTEKVREFLRGCGWPDPILNDSGNGFHLLYRVHLPAADGGLVQRILKALAARFDGEGVTIDKSVWNAAQIIKLPGTVAKKGDDTPERPHRPVRILEVPGAPDASAVLPVPIERLEAVAAEAPKEEPPPSTNGTTYNSRLLVDRWLSDSGVTYRKKEQPDAKGRTVYVLKECPFDSSHSDPDSCIMQSADGKMQFRCLHNSCAEMHWQNVKEKIGDPQAHHYDPPLKKRKTKTKVPDWSDISDTDLGAARQLVQFHGNNIRFCFPWGKWLVWDGCRWRIDNTGAIHQLAKETVRRLLRLAAEEKDRDRQTVLTKLALAGQTLKGHNAMISMARDEPGVPILPAEVDRNRWLLNLPNGTLDLRTGSLQTHRRQDVITKLCPTLYESAAECARWEAFLVKLFAPKLALIVYLQRLLGRCLTGDITEQTLAIFHGSGANGKSTLLAVILAILGGDYAMQAARDLIMVRRGEQHPTGLADLHGKRLVVASETADGGRLDEALVKDLTGGEPIRARRMREDFWQFDPTHKLIVSTNHRPKVGSQDHAMWRRLRLLPFDRYFWDADTAPKTGETRHPEMKANKHLREELLEEAPGILAWMVEGCHQWQEEGPGEPEEVRSATAEYQQDEDLIGPFIAERCVKGDDKEVRASALYQAFRLWCEKGGEHRPPSQTSFGTQLTRLGFKRLKKNTVSYLGLDLLPEEPRAIMGGTG